MRGAIGPGRFQAGGRLGALLLVCALVWATGEPPRGALATGCSGDERLLLAPTEPLAGMVLIVAAVSKTPHEHVLLLGPAGPLETQREAFNDLYIWKATLVPATAGEQLFAFGVVDGAAQMTSCAEAIVTVTDGAAAAPPDGAPSDAAVDASGAPPDATPTPPDGPFTSSVLFASLHPWTTEAAARTAQEAPATPPYTPEPDPIGVASTPDPGRQASASDGSRPSRSSSRSSQTGNGNENDNDAEPTPTRTPTSTRTPTPTKTPTLRPTATPTLAPPAISSISPEVGTCGQVITIRGQRFGETRDDVDGKVRVDGRDASVVSWSMSEVSARLALSTRGGPERLLEVIVAEKVTTRTLRVSC